MPIFVYLLIVLLSLSFMGCEKSGPTSVRHFYDTIHIDGSTRSYLLNLPPNYDGGNNFPLVVALHGFGGKASQMEQDYRLTEKSNSAQFVIVYPEGTSSNGPLGLQSWNAGTCCDVALERQVNDVAFISGLIRKISMKYKVNSKRVYIMGMSNGAMMTYRLACEIPEQIAAIAPVSGTLLTAQPCQPSRAVPVLHAHSILDNTVPYRGGVGLGGYYYPPADSALRVWAAINGCQAMPIPASGNALYTKWRYDSCTPHTTVELNLTNDGGHSWPGGLAPRPGADAPSQAFNATDVIWEFFQQYELP